MKDMSRQKDRTQEQAGKCVGMDGAEEKLINTLILNFTSGLLQFLPVGLGGVSKGVLRPWEGSPTCRVFTLWLTPPYPTPPLALGNNPLKESLLLLAELREPVLSRQEPGYYGYGSNETALQHTASILRPDLFYLCI